MCLHTPKECQFHGFMRLPFNINGGQFPRLLSQESVHGLSLHIPVIHFLENENFTFLFKYYLFHLFFPYIKINYQIIRLTHKVSESQLSKGYFIKY